MVIALIKVSVVIMTRDEEKNLPGCLQAVQKDFDDIIVFDSNSTDRTIEVARECGAHVESFEWNGQYPKKRQYFLDNIKTKYDYILFVDADEQVTPELIAEIQTLDLSCAGYFVQGVYNWRGISLRHGLRNNKLALFNRHQFEFPEVSDLGSFCMGEMEGHYQPVLKADYQQESLGMLQNSLHHFAYDDEEKWLKRHEKYAIWEAGMIATKAYPREDNMWRDMLKSAFRHMPMRGWVAFFHSYLFKLGFFDGKAGLDFANSRKQYYQMVDQSLWRFKNQ